MTTIKAVDIRAEPAGLPSLLERSADTPAPDRITVLSATPQPTEHTSEPDPRGAA